MSSAERMRLEKNSPPEIRRRTTGRLILMTKMMPDMRQPAITPMTTVVMAVTPITTATTMRS